MEKGATLTLSLPCNTNKKLPMLLEKRNGIENSMNGNGGVLHNGMSLFQDLKLKRRKVDSRCSSDGESIGTSESTSSLSPDAQPQGGEGSPKAEKERCLTPEDLVAPGPVSKSNGFPSQFFFMMKNESRNKPNSNNNNNNYDSIKGTNGVKLTSATVTTANVVVVKSEPGDDSRSTPSSSPGLEQQHRKSPVKRREPSPLKDASSSPQQQLTNGHTNGHMTNGSTTNGHGSDSDSVASVKSEKVVHDEDKRMIIDEDNKDDKMDHDDDMRNRQSLSLSSSPRSMLSSASSTGSRGSPPRSHHNHHQGIIASSPRRSPPQNSRENNPSTLIITKANKGETYSQRSSPMSHHSSSSRGGSPPQLLNPHLPPHMTSVMGGHHPPPGLFHANQLHARLTENRREREGTPNGNSPMVHVEIRNLSENNNKNNSGEPPLSVVTSTSLSFQQGSMYRINGVRPEVISGGAVTPTVPGANNNGGQQQQQQSMPSSNHNSHQNHHHHQQQLISNGTGPQHLHPHVMSNGHAMNNGLSITNHHGPFHQGNRKSPSQLSRSPNSSPSNSSSSGSIQHSPGSTGSGGTIIAGGNIGMVNSSTNSNGTHHVNLSRTPTVIMGEAGGVRTMLWSQPGQTIPNPALEIGLGGASPPGSGNSSISSGASSNGSASYGSHNGQINSNASNGSNSNGHPAIQKGVLSMERLWASEALNLSTGASNTTNGHGNLPTSLANGHPTNNDDDDYEQPMICMICEDRATGLHYGIITCEGCKGFFKRTVQNRRVYTCVADGTCEITKAQRNRCQYCRFKKCIEQGMVLQAVREDRMPGGRNSGAVYNLYKVPVKYRKHKKGNRAAANGKGEKASNNNSNASSNNPSPTSNLNNTNNSNGQSVGNNSNGLTSMLPPHPGNILMAALTSPNEGIPRRQHMPFDQAASMINSLVQCDNFHDIAALHNWEELLEARGDLSDKLCQMGDSIVYRLVQWTKRLPFYSELPVEVHTRVLTHKWHELLVLTTSAWHAMHSPPPPPGLTAEEETMENLQVLQRCLQAMMGRSLTLEQLKQDVGQMVERLTYLTRTFRRLGIRLEEYVSLKVIAMLQNTGTKANEVSQIQERYIKVLRTFLEMTVPSQPNRLTELLRCLPEVQAAASLLLESKMFYVPFLLNSALLQR